MSLSALSLPELLATILFALAVLHTFSTRFFASLAHRHPAHAGLLHLLAEVEVVFGVWAFALIALMFALVGKTPAIDYLQSRNFTEPLFVFAIMVIAASRPIVFSVIALVRRLTRLLPLPANLATFFLCLALVPLLGSFITEPAAMTLAALLLRDRFFRLGLSQRLKYATLGVLFVNVSIGGTLTNFAAPPVLMVAGTWDWSSAFMFQTFGWKAALAVCLNAGLLTLLFSRELTALPLQQEESGPGVPWAVSAVHLACLSLVVVFAHYPPVFLGIFLFFLGYTEAYRQYQDRLVLREGLLVAFFLAGLVVLGGLQQWWLQPALAGLDATPLFFLATALTAITDNAALTYLASLVQGVSAEFKYAVVAGAVSGGGLTIIANAPNPAGVAILKSSFSDATVSPGGLFLAALLPTCVAVLAFLLL